MRNNIIAMKDGRKVEAYGVINQELQKNLVEEFDANFFNEIKIIIDSTAKKLIKMGEGGKIKNEMVPNSGWAIFKAQKVQEDIAKSIYGDVFPAHTSKLAEILKKRIGISLTVGTDLKSITKANKQYIRHRASVNGKLSGQISLDGLDEVVSEVPPYISEKYDLTGVLLYHLDDNNKLETFKLVFLDETGKAPLLIIHAPESMLANYVDIIEYEDTKVVDETWEKQEEYSLKEMLVIK